MATGASVKEHIWDAVVAERARAERVARARCASPQDAEDCVQEAMARVVAMPAVDAARIGPLLATVTANLAADTHRRSARAERAEPRLRAWATPQPTPEEIVCDAEEAKWLWLRRQALGTQDREVLELRVQGRSVAETAEELGLTYKAAEASFTRARARMRAIWRATAAALGILWGRPRREFSVAAPAYVAAAVAALAFVLLPGSPHAAPSAPGTPEPHAAAPAPAADAGAGAGAGAEGVAGAQAAPAGAATPADPTRLDTAGTPPVTRTQIARREPAQVDGITVGATTVTREREQENLQQTIERCLREGLIVSVTEVDCNG
jgi:RNA polymerase sigma-70 factor (ECF subfamily)